jgi:alcohol dehydrogenase class IV
MASYQFTFASPGRLVFGPGRLSTLPTLAAAYGNRILFLTGKASFRNSRAWERITAQLTEKDLTFFPVSIPGEPSPDMVDCIVRDHREISLVIALGGGSVLDAGKAVSAMMGRDESVEPYLEGVGTREHDGKKIPFIAVPTTSGTGSEATKNAVLSTPGPSGYKKSLRHDNFIPDIALVDPELTRDCPHRVTAACGMDALTQLIEAFVSVKASPMTDALCRSGLEGFGPALAKVLEKDPRDIEARSRLSYGAYISGLALANAGLGTVHGFASVIGGMAPNRHGEVCGTLLAETTRETIQALEKTDSDHPALARYAESAVLLGAASESQSTSEACGALIDRLDQWTDVFSMPRLSACGITKQDIPAIVRATGQKNNPAVLTKQALASILDNRV